MRMRFFRDEFQQRFIIQRGLLRFGQPRFAQRLQPREVVACHEIIRQQRRFEQQRSIRFKHAGRRKIFRALKRHQGRARLRTD